MASWCDTCGEKVLSAPDSRTRAPKLKGRGNGQVQYPDCEYDTPRPYVADRRVNITGRTQSVLTLCSRCWPPSWNKETG